MMYPVGEEIEQIRIGTAEREDAMRLLSRQFSERSAAISAALTRADLAPVFADLPDKPGVPVVGDPTRDPARDWRSIVMALVPLVALAFTILVPHGWLAWLALPVVGMLLYGRRR